MVAMSSEGRRENRQRVVKLGKIIFGVSDITVDCMIRDETPHGVLVETETPVTVPQEVKIRFANGGTFQAIRRWVMGNKIGFEFVGARVNNNTTLATMRAIHTILQTQGITQAVQSLRISRFFDNEELRLAAEDAENATKRLELLLLGRCPD